jgi:hypothetical protein
MDEALKSCRECMIFAKRKGGKEEVEGDEGDDEIFEEKHLTPCACASF